MSQGVLVKRGVRWHNRTGMLEIFEKQKNPFKAEQLRDIDLTKLRSVYVENPIVSSMWAQILNLRDKSEMATVKLSIQGPQKGLKELQDEEFQDEDENKYYFEELTLHMEHEIVTTNFIKSFVNLKMIDLNSCKLEADFSSIVFRKLTQFHASDCSIDVLPSFPKIEYFALDSNIGTINLPLNYPNLRNIDIKDSLINSEAISHYGQNPRVDFNYNDIHNGIQASEPEVVNNLQASEPGVVNHMETYQEGLHFDPVVSTTNDHNPKLEQNFRSDQEVWNSETCSENFDAIFQDKFDPQDQIVTIVVNLNNSSSVAHCFVLQNLIDLWFPTLQGNDVKNHHFADDPTFEDNRDNQIYKWLGGENGKPIVSEPVFKIPILEVWIDYDAYKLITKYNSHCLIKVSDNQKIGSAFGVSRMHGTEVKLYSVFPINRDYLRKSIKNKTPMDFLVNSEDLNVYKPFSPDSPDPTQMSTTLIKSLCER